MRFRYGAVVLFNPGDAGQTTFLTGLGSHMDRPVPRPETGDSRILVGAGPAEGGCCRRHCCTDLELPRLHVVAITLARSVALRRHEMAMAAVFDVLEPRAQELAREGRSPHNLRQLLQHIGGTLSAPANMIGRVEIQDKSGLLWDPPELDNLCVRPESEHELREHNTVPERKRALTSHAAETALNLLHNRRLLRVEWYIVVLIVVDIALYTHEIRLKR